MKFQQFELKEKGCLRERLERVRAKEEAHVVMTDVPADAMSTATTWL